MALVNCPICGKSVSDKAEKCVRCGYSLKSRNFIRCKECGAILEDDDTICKNCGCPIEEDEPEISEEFKYTETPDKPVKSKKKVVRKVITAIILVLLVFVCLDYNKTNKEIEYYNDLADAFNTMISCAAETEDCGNLVINVWNDAIWHKWDNDTKAFTMKNGTYVSDFNDALDALYKDEKFSLRVSTIYENQQVVIEYVEKLSDPPEKFSNAYDKFCDTCDVFIEFTNMIVNPNGSLKSYSEEFGETDRKLADKFNEFDLYLDNLYSDMENL